MENKKESITNECANSPVSSRTEYSTEKSLLQRKLLKQTKEVVDMACDAEPQKGKAIVKLREWTCIAYPDSLADNWVDILAEESYAISPLHDKDVVILEDGSTRPKKPHWHIFLKFENPISYNSVLNICKQIHATIPKMVRNPKATLEYFWHKNEDPKKKFIYDERDMIYNRFDPWDVLDPDKDERSKLMLIFDLIVDNDITEYCDLLDLLRNEKTQSDLFLFVHQHSHSICKHIDSRRNKIKDKRQKQLEDLDAMASVVSVIERSKDLQ